MAYMKPSKHNQGKHEEHQQHVKRNKFIIYLILVCLTMEIPFRRFALANKSISILIARARFLLFVWLAVKFSVAILLQDCQYSSVRALMWDWTIYYPVNRRTNLLRCFLSMYAYHLCIKASAFVGRSKKPFDASLLDFLTHPPPLALPLNLSVSTTSRNLRDRQHWFELSEKLYYSFKRVLWWLLPVCSIILLGTSVRMGYLLEIERNCDMRMPLLRLVGLLESNFVLMECALTYVGSFTYSLLVKHDLLLQADRVELYLVEVVTKFKTLASDTQHNDEEEEEVDAEDYLLFAAMSSNQKMGQVGGESRFSYKQLPDMDRWWVSTSDPRRSDQHNYTSRHPPVALVDYSRQQFGSVKYHNRGKKYQSRYSLNNESFEPLMGDQRDLQEAIREAQNRVTLFLKCIDSHKPAVSYLGSVMLIWLITSLSWVPVLFGNWNEPGASLKSNIIYLLCCTLNVITSLVYTAICAGVYQRSIELAAKIFRLCAKHHGKSEAVRWNKILLIWFSPNRCALHIGNFFQLTYLNILKSISFLVSGLTFIVNYLSN